MGELIAKIEVWAQATMKEFADGVPSIALLQMQLADLQFILAEYKTKENT